MFCFDLFKVEKSIEKKFESQELAKLANQA